MSVADRVTEAERLLREAHDELLAELKSERTRRRGHLNLQLHLIRRRLMPGYDYTSQAGQDFIVDRLLGERAEGVFVDVGGHDGRTGSNTLFFESRRRWSGLLIEAAESLLAEARRYRRCECVECAVSDEDGEAEFIEVTEGLTQMSGLSGTYDKALLGKVRADPRHRERARTVRTRRLDSILREHGIERADFVSLDIEGGELAVLRTFPFDDLPVEVWAIENNTGQAEIREIMTKNGYALVEFAGVDEIYSRR